MRPLDLARMSTGALTRQRRRSLLCLVGLAIGVSAVIVLTAVGEGARGYVESQFEVLGSHTLVVLPGKVETTGALPGFGGVPNDLTLADARAVRERVPGVLRVSPVVVGNDTVEAGGRSRQVAILGTNAEFREVRGLSVRHGRFLPEGPWEAGAPVAVLGTKLATELFPAGDALGSLVRAGGWRLRVIGVLAPQGMTFGFDMDEVALIPVSTSMAMFNRSSLFRIPTQLRPGSDMDLASKRVRTILVERHGEEDFTITTPNAVVDTLGGILTALTLALAGIAAISLIVAGIGIMNVMLVTVSERRGEIGLLAAIGATRRQVLAVFLAEAAALSLAGAALGLAVGWVVVRGLVVMAPAFPASPPLWAVGASVGLSLVTGIAFGWWPAQKAVRLDPIQALAGSAR